MDELADGTAVVIDVLRATTTIVTALAAGATRVIPCVGVEEARWLAHERYRGARLGGERGGLTIEGFDFGNSPAEYMAEHIAAKTLVFTTTNGTQALRHCERAKEVLIASFLNVAAVAQQLVDRQVIHLVCAGTDGTITREDVLLAGALVVQLCELRVKDPTLNDEAELAADAWRETRRSVADGQELAYFLRQSRGGQNLAAIGHETDVTAAARVDCHPIVPRYDTVTGEIVIVAGHSVAG
jgi:2-phosphosulfolactate phosphatase